MTTIYTAKNVTDLLQVVNFTGLLQLYSQQVTTNLLISSSCKKSVLISYLENAGNGYRVPGIENTGMENAGSHGKRGYSDIKSNAMRFVAVYVKTIQSNLL